MRLGKKIVARSAVYDCHVQGQNVASQDAYLVALDLAQYPAERVKIVPGGCVACTPRSGAVVTLAEV